MSHENPSTDLVIDIETYQDIPDEVLESRRAQISAPSNYKDPEKIAKYIEEKTAEIVEKAALSPLTGRVVAVGMGLRRHGGDWEFACLTDRINDEQLLLARVDSTLFDVGHGHLITFDGTRFDIPFLVARAMRHGMLLRYRWPLARYSKRHIDLFTILQSGSLGDWSALVLGESKKATGADVAAMVEQERWDDLKTYCLADVRITARLYDAIERCAWLDRR
jgi:DNA polymerase elongation subunit (family B)